MPDQSSAATEHAILQEITRPLEALPDDPLSVVNAEFPTALRGYERMAVDDYVRRTRQLVAELQATRSPEAAVRRALERVGEEITGILQRAHETAEQITAQSRSEAEDRLMQARGEAAQIADAAEERVRELDGDTDRIWLERQRIVADAEDLAGQLLALAKTAADRFPADADADSEPEPAAASGSAEVPIDEQEDLAYVDDDDGGAPAPEPSFAGGDEEDEEYFDFEVDERPEQSEIEKTVAFQPIEREDETEAVAGESETRVDPPATPSSSPSSAPSSAPSPSPEQDTKEHARNASPASEDSTAVIPPASQAASRRLGQ
jgi:hypothetical protein